MNSITNFLSKTFKTKSNYGSILHNRIILYFFCIMAIVDVIYFASTNDIKSLVTLLIVGFLASFFNKNMIIILFTALVITHILKYGTNVSEGLENADTNETKKDEVETKSDADETAPVAPDNKKKSKTQDSSGNTPATIEQLKNEYSDFQAIQEQILSGTREIDQLLTKAETFIEKYEGYKASKKDGYTNKESLTSKK